MNWTDRLFRCLGNRGFWRHRFRCDRRQLRRRHRGRFFRCQSGFITSRLGLVRCLSVGRIRFRGFGCRGRLFCRLFGRFLRLGIIQSPIFGRDSLLIFARSRRAPRRPGRRRRSDVVRRKLGRSQDSLLRKRDLRRTGDCHVLSRERVGFRSDQAGHRAFRFVHQRAVVVRDFLRHFELRA